jgi:hypothetical protein
MILHRCVGDTQTVSPTQHLDLASSAPGALTTRHPVMFTETHPERDGAPKDDMEPGPRTPSYTGNDGGKCAGVADVASMAWRTSHALTTAAAP